MDLSKSLVDLKKLATGLGVGLTVKRNSKGQYSVNGRNIYFVSPTFSGEDLKSGDSAVIAGNFSAALKDVLQRRRISYFSVDDLELCLFTIKACLVLKPGTKKESPASLSFTSLQATDVLSPNGLEIADLVLRLPSSFLQEFKSANSFARRYSLSQPKLSRVMTSTNAQNLTDLQQALRDQPLDWWELAFALPLVRRKLRPFFALAEDYHSLNRIWNVPAERLLLSHPSLVQTGPVQTAVAIGHLVESTFDYWISAEVLKTFKRDLKLVPGSNKNGVTFRLATLEPTLDKQAINSKLFRADVPPNTKMSNLRQNLLRAAWDLAQGDERQKIAAMEIVRGVLS